MANVSSAVNKHMELKRRPVEPIKKPVLKSEKWRPVAVRLPYVEPPSSLSLAMKMGGELGSKIQGKLRESDGLKNAGYSALMMCAVGPVGHFFDTSAARSLKGQAQSLKTQMNGISALALSKFTKSYVHLTLFDLASYTFPTLSMPVKAIVSKVGTDVINYPIRFVMYHRQTSEQRYSAILNRRPMSFFHGVGYAVARDIVVLGPGMRAVEWSQKRTENRIEKLAKAVLMFSVVGFFAAPFEASRQFAMGDKHLSGMRGLRDNFRMLSMRIKQPSFLNFALLFSLSVAAKGGSLSQVFMEKQDEKN